MPFATAACDARVARRIAAAAAAVALQGAFYWLSLQETIEPTVPPAATPVEAALFQAVRRPHPLKLPRQERRMPSREAAPKMGGRPALAPTAQPTAASQRPHSVSPARIDWRRALQSAARAGESGSRAQRLQFGFPRRPGPGPAPAAPKFGWDYARTHRVEPLPEGGILINLTDHCALVLYGLMLLPGCRIGRIPANGHLFDYMHDRQYDRPGALP